MAAIYFETDLYKRYSERRKNMPLEEVQDLFECLIKYMKSEMKYKNTHYAVDFAGMGHMYRKPHKEKPQSLLETNSSVMEDIWMELCYNTKGLSNVNLLDRKGVLEGKNFSGKSLEQIQKQQNEAFKDN